MLNIRKHIKYTTVFERKNILASACLVIGVAGLATNAVQAAATSGTWANPSGTSPFSWTTGSNWTITSGSGSYPSGADGVATFTNPGAPYTVDIGSNPITIGSIDASFNANHSLAITSGTLNFATSTGTPGLTWTSTLGGPVISFSGLTVTGSQGLVITGSTNFGTSFRTYGSTNWSGFSGTVALTQGNWDPQSSNAAPANSDLILGGTDTNPTNDPAKARFGMFAGRNQTIGALIGGSAAYMGNNNTTSFSTLTLGHNNDSGTFAGNIGQDSTHNLINVVKTGTGTETFSGTDIYSGTTTINAGKLAVTGSLTGGGAVTVNTGAALAGTGTISGAVTVNGGAINLVDGSTGTLTLASGVTLASGSLAFDIGSGGASDLIDVTGGSISATGAVAVNITGLSGFGAGTYNLISGTSTGLSNLTLGTTPGGAFSYALQSSTNGEQLVVSAVPEPASLALAAAGAMGLLLMRRKSRTL